MRIVIAASVVLLGNSAPGFAAKAPAKADLMLVMYSGLYQGNAAVSSAGGVTGTTLGSYKNYDDCVQAQSRLKMNFVRKGTLNEGGSPGDVLSWGALCVEKQP